MSAVDVLAVMDRMVASVGARNDRNRDADLANAHETRTAVAEAFAERDRLRNIVRSHEAQILRMTAERAELRAAIARCGGAK